MYSNLDAHDNLQLSYEIILKNNIVLHFLLPNEAE